LNHRNNCFLLGAGFTNAITSGKAPLTNSLLPKLKDIIIPEVEEDFNKFQDIELFITSVEIRIRNEKCNRVKQKLQEFIKSVEEKIIGFYDIDKFNEDYPLCRKFVEQIPKDACILTTNYDCVLDRYLWLSGKWCPTIGYSASAFPSNCSDCNENSNCNKNILLLKLHGSCNFREPRDEQPYKQLNWNGHFSIEITKEIFPRINSYINSRRSSIRNTPHVLIMSYLKIYGIGIMGLWNKAIEILSNSERLVIIGSSLRDEDIFLKYALYHFGMKPCMGKFSVEIVDQSYTEVKGKISRLVANPDQQEYKTYKSLDEYLSSN
jgi:hypothetical protein